MGQLLHGRPHRRRRGRTGTALCDLGFDGFVVSDWQAIDQIPGDYASDVRTSINAGLDMIMVPYDYQGFTSTSRSSGSGCSRSPTRTAPTSATSAPPSTGPWPARPPPTPRCC